VTTALVIAALAIGTFVFLLRRSRPPTMVEHSQPPPEVQRVAKWLTEPDSFDFSREPLNPYFAHRDDGELTDAQRDGLAAIAIYVETWLRSAGLFGVEGRMISEKLSIIGAEDEHVAMLMDFMIENGRARREHDRFFAT
jgi:hypothetical protein